MHTSASLALNESWDPDVRDDMEMMLNKIVPEGLPYRHSCEGPDDMVSFDMVTLLTAVNIPVDIDICFILCRLFTFYLASDITSLNQQWIFYIQYSNINHQNFL